MMQIKPVKQNFNVYIGSTFTYAFIWENYIEGVASIQNLEGYTAAWSIYAESETNTWRVITTTPDANGSSVELKGIEGLIVLTLSAKDSSEIEWKTARYQLLLEKEGVVTPIMIGKLISETVSRP